MIRELIWFLTFDVWVDFIRFNGVEHKSALKRIESTQISKVINQIKAWLKAFWKCLNRFISRIKWKPLNLFRINSRFITKFRNLNKFKAQLMLRYCRLIWFVHLSSVAPKLRIHQNNHIDSIQDSNHFPRNWSNSIQISWGFLRKWFESTQNSSEFQNSDSNQPTIRAKIILFWINSWICKLWFGHKPD